MAPLPAHSVPPYEAFASAHGYDLTVTSIDDAAADDEAIRRRVRWRKVDLLADALESYDVVVWIDADAMFCRFDRDMADDVPVDRFQGLSLEVFPTRVNPNTGVWLLRRDPVAFAFLDAVRSTGQPLHSWSDQAAVCVALGWHLGDYHGHGARPERPSRFGPGTAWLAPTWNDVSGRCVAPRVKHFAGLPLQERARRMAAERRRLREEDEGRSRRW
ncbi:MAG TPA: hypothetical protein VG455_12315 [Acidimicrobiales bacterium]|nr:hypothetical protein [Acidimicrobiales bacterium]